MIYFFTPYSLEKKLGKAYNQYCNLVPNDDDWICLTDGDTMFLTPEFGYQLQMAINLKPNTGLFTCYTNRVGNLEQTFPGMYEEKDIIKHRIKAIEIQNNNFGKFKMCKGVISGHLLLFRKDIWKRAGGFHEEGILKVDNLFSQAIHNLKLPIYLIEWVYILHYYRALEGRNYRNHLK